MQLCNWSTQPLNQNVKSKTHDFVQVLHVRSKYDYSLVAIMI